MTKLQETAQMYMVYSSAQLYRFLSKTIINPGTRLQPVNVDNMVRIMPYPPFGSDIDPYVSEVPYALNKISWSMKDTGHIHTDDIGTPVLAFVEIYSLDSNQIAIADQDYWENYFHLDKHSMVAPNGVLFQSPDDSGELSIKLQDDGDDLLFGYGVVFTVTVDGEKNPIYCRIDPIAAIRSSNEGN